MRTGLSKKRRKIKPKCAPTLFPWNDWGKRPPTVTARRRLQRFICNPLFLNLILRPVALILPTKKMKKLLHVLLLLLTFLKKSVLYNWRPKPKHYKRNAFLHDQIVVLKKKSFCLDNFTSSDEKMAFYTGLDRGRF